MTPESEINEKLKVILTQPYEFNKAIGKKLIHSYTKKDLIQALHNSYFRDLFQDISQEDFYDLFNKFRNEMNIIRDWLLNSEIRMLSFYFLGKKGAATSSELSEIIKRHPKSISIYIQEFSDKKWVELIPDNDARKKRYTLSEIGISYFNYFEPTLESNKKKSVSIESCILEIVWFYPIIFEGVYDLMDVVEKTMIPESADFLISEIKEISKKILEELNVNLEIPEIRQIGLDSTLLSVNSIDNFDLALIFMSFNFLYKNAPRNIRSDSFSLIPKIQRIKILNVESYFDFKMPFIDSQEGFLNPKKTDEYISKILVFFKDKINELKNKKRN